MLLGSFIDVQSFTNFAGGAVTYTHSLGTTPDAQFLQLNSQQGNGGIVAVGANASMGTLLYSTGFTNKVTVYTIYFWTPMR